MIIGYARVSTDGQTLDAQHSTLIAAGAERVFAEKVSGGGQRSKGASTLHGRARGRRRSVGDQARSPGAQHS